MRTHNIPISIWKRNHHKLSYKSAAMGFFSKGLKNEFKIAVVHEPSAFEPRKAYCIFPNCKEAFKNNKIELRIL